MASSSTASMSTAILPDDFVDIYLKCMVIYAAEERAPKEETLRMMCIPKSVVFRCTISPYKWLRMVSFHVVGIAGDLERWGLDSNTGIDFAAHDFTDRHESFVFTTQGRAYLINLSVDENPHVAPMACPAHISRTHGPNSYTSATESGDTPQAKRQQAFSEYINNRDGCCPFTLTPKGYCHACHFIPFAKGNSTIASWTTHRLRMMIEAGGPHGHTPRDKIVHINDPRNGLLMTKLLNGLFNSALTIADERFAILVTPNYLFSASDLPKPTNYTAEEFLVINRDAPLPEELQGVSPKGLRARRVANGQRGYTLHRFSKTPPTISPAKHGLDSL
ncbi:hypothetical protein C8J57DRAFT_1709621, partial [Mycena rebaudengoi]